MRYLQAIAVSLAIALAAGALSGASAWASEHVLPEAGRCVKVTKGTGAYRGGACITVYPGNKGAYEWVPASLLEKETFSGIGSEAILQTTGKPTIKCVGAGITGEWVSARTATVTLSLQGCQNPQGEPCGTVEGQTKGEIASPPLEGVLGFVRNELKEGKLIVVAGLDLKPLPPLTTVTTYECGGRATEPVRIEGSVIGRIKPIDKMTEESNLVYLAKNGAQYPESFQESAPDTLTSVFTSGLETSSAPTTLTIKAETGKYSTPMEIKGKEN
jgi:hypothetical protein